MNCNEVKDKLFMYVDNELSKEEINLIDEHLSNCHECMHEYTIYKNILCSLKKIPDEEPPKGYCNRLRDKLLMVKENTKKSNRVRWIKYGSIAASAVLVCAYGITMFLPGRLSSNYGEMMSDSTQLPTTESSHVAPDSKMSMDSSAEMENSVGGIASVRANQNSDLSVAQQREAKIIKSGNLTTQTEEYDAFLNDIITTVESYQGYVERNNTDVIQVYSDKKLKRGYLEVRIPQDKFYEFVSYIENRSDINQKNITETDVSKQYYDKYNQVENLQIQEEHLRKLFEKAETMADTLQIENELRRIRTEIDALNMDLRDIDDRTSMSKVTLEIEEVLKANIKMTDGDTVWQRSKEGFINTVNTIVQLVENILITLISAIPVLIPVSLIVSVFIWIRKKRN